MRLASPPDKNITIQVQQQANVYIDVYAFHKVVYL